MKISFSESVKANLIGFLASSSAMAASDQPLLWKKTVTLKVKTFVFREAIVADYGKVL